MDSRLTETSKHFKQRLVASIGTSSSVEDLKGQFLFGTSPAVQASLKALKCNFRFFWEDLLSAAESDDIRQRSPIDYQPVAAPRRTGGIITAASSPSLSGSCSDNAPFQYQVNTVTSFEDNGDADEKDAYVFLAQQFYLAENRPSRGYITCFLCFGPRHVVVDYNLLPEKEVKELLEHSSSFLSRRTRSAWNRTLQFIPRLLPLYDQLALSGIPEGER